MPAKTKFSPESGFVPPGLVLLIQFLTVAALAIACYLLWVSLAGGAVAGCGPDSGCDRVLHSRWSRWLGIPVSAIALLLYLAILATTFRLRPSVNPVEQRKAWRVLVPAAVALLGVAIWFIIVQAFILKSFCPFCMTAHGCGLVAGALLLFCAPFRNPPEKPWQQEKEVFVPPPLARKLVWISLAGLVLFVSGQFVRLPRKEYVVKIFDGKIQMNLREVPVIGQPEAPYSIVSLFDYTCHHCRIMHGHLMEAHRKFGNQLAIISLPMPLCEKCNYTVKRSPKIHAEACDYARIGLALWRAKPEAQAEFDDWIFAPSQPPALAQARQQATQMAGAAALEKALKDPWVEEQIQRDVSIYATNNARGIGNMPQLIIGTNVASGTFTKVDQLYKLLADNLGLKEK